MSAENYHLFGLDMILKDNVALAAFFNTDQRLLDW